MLLKANWLTIKKGKDMKMILIREDKKVMFNFGSEEWIDFNLMGNMDIKNQKYQEHIKSPNFKKNYLETKKVIEISKDYEEITQKFIKDFKNDRGNRIWLNTSEMEVKDV
jgi:hypothetical protein